MPQCAALSPHLALRRVPPQKMVGVVLDCERPTCVKKCEVQLMIKQFTINEFNSYLPSNIAPVGIGSSNHPSDIPSSIAQATYAPEKVRLVHFFPVLVRKYLFQ